MRPMALLQAAIIVATTAWRVVGVAPLHAQSLADVARAEEARRKEIKQHARVYTNKDLVSVPSPVASHRRRRAASTDCQPPYDYGQATIRHEGRKG